MYYDTKPSVPSFISTMEAHGIRCELLSQEEFNTRFYRLSSSFTDSHHDVAAGVFYYTKKVTVKDMTHEIGHLVCWDLIGRPQYNNFGLDRGRSFGVDLECRNLVTQFAGSVDETFGSNVDYNEVAACAVEAAINCQHRGRRAAADQMRTQEYTDPTHHQKRLKTSAVVDGMLIIGEALIEAHRQRRAATAT